MAKKKAKRRYSRKAKGHKGKSLPSVFGAMSVAIPQGLSLTGAPEIGYNVFDHGLDIGTRIKYALADEAILFTGIDPIAPNPVRTKALMLNYGLPIVHKIVRMVFGPRRVGKLSVW